MLPINIYSEKNLALKLPFAQAELNSFITSQVDEFNLRDQVEGLCYPRHFLRETAENKRAAIQIAQVFQSYGYEVQSIGEFYNVLAYKNNLRGKDVLLLGAHFDSVPTCPAADDNASAVVGMLEVAKLFSLKYPNFPIVFAAFNREEDGFLGSSEVVSHLIKTKLFTVLEAHILEMIGYASNEKNSQSFPRLLSLDDKFSTGNFIAAVGNPLASETLKTLINLNDDLPSLAIEVTKEIPQISDLFRSDHVPFWEHGISAIQWTDTANFRNRNYHKKTDTPDTLNYGFMKNVIKSVLATLIFKAYELNIADEI